MRPAPARYLPTRGARAFCLVCVTLAWAPVACPAAHDAGEPVASAQRKRELQDEQRDLKERLARLKKTIAQTESARTEAADALAASETAISTANRQLQQIASNRHQLEQRIAELQARQEELRNAQATHTSRLGSTLQAEQQLLEEAAQRSWRDPGGSVRDEDQAAYLDSVVVERSRRIGEIDDRRTQLKALEEESHARSAELAHLDEAERRGRAQLVRQQEARRSALDKLGAQLEQQRRSVAALERDDARLGDLITRIGRLLAEQQAQHARSRNGEAHGNGKGALPSVLDPAHAVAMNATQFARFKGRLRLPVQGSIASKFGAPRTTEDGQTLNGAPSWKGVILKAPTGTPVHALAAGQVVFSDWLRGFGNLLILDHGEGFLSVYAFNESLLHSVGDHVGADDIISTVGNSGGNAHSSLYFEMRYQGQPFDPLTWAVAR